MSKPFVIGQICFRNDGRKVHIIEEKNQKGYECVKTSAGGWCYNRDSDRGRCTGAEMNDPRSIIPTDNPIVKKFTLLDFKSHSAERLMRAYKLAVKLNYTFTPWFGALSAYMMEKGYNPNKIELQRLGELDAGQHRLIEFQTESAKFEEYKITLKHLVSVQSPYKGVHISFYVIQEIKNWNRSGAQGEYSESWYCEFKDDKPNSVEQAARWYDAFAFALRVKDQMPNALDIKLFGAR